MSSEIIQTSSAVAVASENSHSVEDQDLEDGDLAIFDTLNIDDLDDLVLDHGEEGASIVSDGGYSPEEAYPEPLPRETSAFIEDDGDARMLLSVLSENQPPSPSKTRSSNVVPPSPTGSNQTALSLPTIDMSENAPPGLFIPPPPPQSFRVVTPTQITKKSKKTKSAKKPTRKRAPRKKAPKTKHFVDKTELDVLLGRGGCSNHHAGNATYRKKILELQPKYKQLSRQEKTKFSQSVVVWVQHRGGRFLKRDEKGGPWYITTDHEARAKISQALREDHSPEGRAAKKARNEKAKGSRN